MLARPTLAILTRLTLAAVLPFALATSASAASRDGRRNSPPPRKIIQVDVFGSDPCPKGVGDEIVVCARLPEAERFRIPAPLRHGKLERPDQSWVTRARDIDETSRPGRPDSCSPVGSGGQTGCFQKFMRDARAQREADAAEAQVP